MRKRVFILSILCSSIIMASPMSVSAASSTWNQDMDQTIFKIQHEEYHFDQTDKTAYFVKDSYVYNAPFDNSGKVFAYKRYSKIKLTGVNKLDYWQVSVNNKDYYVLAKDITTSKSKLEKIKAKDKKEEKEKKIAEEEKEVEDKAKTAVSAIWNTDLNKLQTTASDSELMKAQALVDACSNDDFRKEQNGYLEKAKQAMQDYAAHQAEIAQQENNLSVLKDSVEKEKSDADAAKEQAEKAKKELLELQQAQGTQTNNNANGTGTTSTGAIPSIGVADASASSFISIPEPYGSTYTVTCYGTPGWFILNSNYTSGSWKAVSKGTMQDAVHNAWVASGAKYDNGIATLDGRWLVACTTKFGNVGDKVTFYLNDGTALPCIIADQKGEDADSEWGHDGGKNVVELEVDKDMFFKYGNPGSVNWHPELMQRTVAALLEGSYF